MKKISLILTLALTLSLAACGTSGTTESKAAASTSIAVESKAEESKPAESKAEESKAEESKAEESVKETPTPTEEPKQESTAEPAAEGAPLTGSYLLYSLEFEGAKALPSDYGVSSQLTLNEDNTGMIILNGGENPITEWKEADGTITLINAEGSELAVTIEDGVIKMEMGENYYFFYAHEKSAVGAEILKKRAASMTYKLYTGIDMAAAHLAYECHRDYMDSTGVYDVHAKGSTYYCRKIMKVSGVEQLSATLLLDGKVYNLYPDKMEGNYVTEASALENNALMLDDLYQLILGKNARTDYTVETREVEGASYTAEVFPATSFQSEAVLYYNEAGELKYVSTGAPSASPEMGESFYTITAIDNAVDESLFDLSGYTISD